VRRELGEAAALPVGERKKPRAARSLASGDSCVAANSSVSESESTKTLRLVGAALSGEPARWLTLLDDGGNLVLGEMAASRPGERL